MFRRIIMKKEEKKKEAPILVQMGIFAATQPCHRGGLHSDGTLCPGETIAKRQICRLSFGNCEKRPDICPL